jgi:HSP20 family protein
VNEEDERFVVSAEIPGMKAEEVSVKLEGNALIIEARHEEKEEEEGRSYARVGSFRRLFQVPSSVNAETIEAEMADGLLTVFLPKAELPTGKEVPIRKLEKAEETAEKVPVEAPKKEAPKKEAPKAKAPKGKEKAA